MSLNLVVNIKENLINSITTQSQSLFREKLRLNNLYDFNNKKDETLLYELIESPSEYLSQATDISMKLFSTLRSRHDLVYKLLTHCKTKETKECLAKFIMQYFYENIFSSAFIENELLLIMYLSLQNEINSLPDEMNKDGNELFKETINHFLFKNLLRKTDIKSYFGIILKDIISLLATKKESEKPLTFQLNLIMCELIDKKKERSQLKPNTSPSKIRRVTTFVSTSSSKQFNEKEYMNFFMDTNDTYESSNDATTPGNYGMKRGKKENKQSHNQDHFNTCLVSLKLEDLEQLEKNETHKGMKQYLVSHISAMRSNEEIYQNEKFMLIVCKTSNQSNKVFKIYESTFNIVIDVIEMLFDNLLNNYRIIPYSIKCICKMISILINKKYPHLTIPERNRYIAEFFIEKILKPIFSIPDWNGLITSVIVSNNTKKNILLILKIIKELVKGNLFNSNLKPDYTVFNKFFVRIMPRVFEFFDKLIDVKLPPTIEKCIDNCTAPENIIYDYFEENPNEKLTHVSVCFSIYDLKNIFQIIKDNEHVFLNSTPKCEDLNKQRFLEQTQNTFQRTYKKLKSSPVYMAILDELLSNEQSSGKMIYILQSELKFNKHFEEFMKINLRHQSFALPLPNENKETKVSRATIMAPPPMFANANSEIQTKTNIIRVKNFLSKILFNFKELTEEILISQSVHTTEEIINSIKIFLQTDYYLLLNSIPLDWYGDSLMNFLQELPDDYKANDYEKLYNELTYEVEESIKLYNLSVLSDIKTKLKYAERAQSLISGNILQFNKIEVNNKIQKFIDALKLDVQLCIKKQKKDQEEFCVVKNSKTKSTLSYFENFIFDNKTNKGELCSTIHDFIRQFPHFVAFSEYDDDNLCSILRKYKVPEAMEFYLSEIQKNINPTDFNETKEDAVAYEISNFIYGKLYDRLYTNISDDNDFKIYHWCISLNWVEPEHIIPIKGIILNNFLPAAVKHIRRMETEKTPNKKIEEIMRVSELIQSAIVFSTGQSDNSVDDALPFFEYAIIKAQPQFLSSNVNYMEMFLDTNLKKTKYGLILTQLHLIVETLINFSYENLLGLSEEEFNERTLKADIK